MRTGLIREGQRLECCSLDEGYLFDVEVFNYDGSDFGGVPHPSALKILEWSAPDSDGHHRLLNP